MIVHHCNGKKYNMDNWGQEIMEDILREESPWWKNFNLKNKTKKKKKNHSIYDFKYLIWSQICGDAEWPRLV